ncbi:MAG: alpha-amylase family glycosyl hydrolase [Dermatophilaceae bacterium]|nr:hypothetical protein [Intrasporangiaceae bacterium]
MSVRPNAWVTPHHDGSPLYVSTRRPDLGDSVTVRVRVPGASGFSRVHVRTVPDGAQYFTPARVERETGTDTWWRADMIVHNPVTNYRFVLQGGPQEYAWLTGAGPFGRDVPDASDFRLTTFGDAPGWVTDGVVHQIFLDRFARSAGRGPVHEEAPDWAVPARWTDPVSTRRGVIGTQLYGGDLDGIVEHLDHIASLGVTVLYLTPFFPSRSNHRYDASSFYFVAEDRGYISWLDVPSLPELNWDSAGLAESVLDDPEGPVRRWLRAGLSGWRIDVANMTGRHGAQDRNHAVARRMRGAVTAEPPDSFLVAEHVHDYTVDLPGDNWHGVMNYSGFTKPVWTWLRNHDREAGFLGAPVVVPHLPAQTMVETMLDFTSRVGWAQLRGSWNLLGSHDTTRIRTLVGPGADRARPHRSRRARPHRCCPVRGSRYRGGAHRIRITTGAEWRSADAACERPPRGDLDLADAPR